MPTLFIPAAGKVEVSRNVLIDETKVSFDVWLNKTNLSADPFAKLTYEIWEQIDNNNQPVINLFHWFKPEGEWTGELF